MTEQTKQAESSPRPPLPTGSVGRASDSFRRVDYSPPDGVDHQDSGVTGWWKRMTSSGKAEADHVKSDDVVEALSRQSSKGRMSSDSPQLLPVPSPGITKTGSTGRVGLPKVTLVAAEDTPRDQVTNEKTSLEKIDTEATKIEIPKTEIATGKTEIEVTKPEAIVSQVKSEMTQPKEEGPKEAPVEVEVAGTAPVSKEAVAEAVEDAADEEELLISSHRVSVDTVHEKEVETIEPPPVVPEIPATEATAEKVAEKLAGETSPPLKSSQTMSRPSPPQQRSFLRRMFTFGAGGQSATPKEQQKTEDVPKNVLKDAPKEAPKEEASKDIPKDAPKESTEEVVKDVTESKVADSTTSMDDPRQNEPPSTTSVDDPRQSEPPSTEAPVIEAASLEDKTHHIRCTSDMNKEELDVLKHLFMSEMKQAGIDVEGKYHKSSVDFDSPLMFLLDLHIFAETQHSGIKLEQVLRKKYGDDHLVVTEFNEAASQDSETKTEEAVPTEAPSGAAPKDVKPIEKDIVKETPKEDLPPSEVKQEKETPSTPPDGPSEVITDPIDDQPSIDQKEIEEHPPPVSEPGTPPPTIPLLRDESKTATEKTSCFSCICLRP